MVTKAKCLVCGIAVAMPIIEVRAHCRGRVREWRIRVCRDCWRAWEATFEMGALATQPELLEVGSQAEWWFR